MCYFSIVLPSNLQFCFCPPKNVPRTCYEQTSWSHGQHASSLVLPRRRFLIARCTTQRYCKEEEQRKLIKSTKDTNGITWIKSCTNSPSFDLSPNLDLIRLTSKLSRRTWCKATFCDVIVAFAKCNLPFTSPGNGVYNSFECLSTFRVILYHILSHGIHLRFALCDSDLRVWYSFLVSFENTRRPLSFPPTKETGFGLIQLWSICTRNLTLVFLQQFLLVRKAAKSW